MRILSVLLMLFGCATLSGGQIVNLSNWGLNTGFELGQDSKGISHNVADQGVFGLVRDGINWANIETSPGVYSMPANYQAYLNNIQSAGLKMVAIVVSNSCNPPPFYMGSTVSPNYSWPTDAAGQTKIQQALANFCAWLVQNEPMISVVELFNEPNNYFQFTQGNHFTAAQWESIVVNATTAVTSAVHAAKPGVLVASLGGQGQQVLDMIKMAPLVDIVVAHTYPAPNVPERYDNGAGGMDYIQWTQSVFSAIAAAYSSNRPQYWETEWAAWRQGNDANSEEYYSAAFDSHRIPLALSLGISTSIRYQALDPDPAQSDWNDREEPRQVSFVHERIAMLLDGLSPVSSQIASVVSNTTSTVPSGAAVYSPVFANADGSKTSLVIWMGNVMYAGIGWAVPYTVSLNYPASAQSVTAENLVTGEISYPKWSQGGSNVTIQNVPIGNEAMVYTISNTGGVAGGAPTSITIGSDVWAFSATTNSGGNLILRNGQSSNGAAVLMTNISGQLYVLNLLGYWYKWVGVGNGYQGSGWTGVSAPGSLGFSVICAP